VALARALAIRPSVVLLDEPFSSLDASLRGELGRDVARILTEAATTAVLVTHDQDEALALADQIAVLEGGRVVARAEPRALYRDPPDLTAATSIGEANLLAAHLGADGARCALGVVPLRTHGPPGADGPCRLLLRPEQLALQLQGGNGAAAATVIELHYHGHDALARLTLDHPDRETVLARVPGDVMLAPGQQVWVEVSGLGLAWPLERSRSE
jgi:iron(III) transport system ATP-binding protein